MAHFAEIDVSGTVLRVVVVANADASDANGNEVEQIGRDFCNRLLGGSWVQTSYNANFRKNYAGIGYSFDAQRDAFIAPKPFPSWVLNEANCRWEPPTPRPEGDWHWDEETTSWKEITI